MLNYFHYAFADAYWFYSRKWETAACSKNSIPCCLHEQHAETMAQHTHFHWGHILEKCFSPSSPCTLLTSEKPKPKAMNPCKLELLHQLREFIQSSVEVRYIPYYGTEPQQHLRKTFVKGERLQVQLKILIWLSVVLVADTHNVSIEVCFFPPFKRLKSFISVLSIDA